MEEVGGKGGKGGEANARGDGGGDEEGSERDARDNGGDEKREMRTMMRERMAELEIPEWVEVRVRTVGSTVVHT